MSEPVNKKQGRVWDLSQEEKEQICQTFTLLDKDGDDVITIPDLEFLLISLGRLPFDNDLAQILAYGEPRSHENANSMDYKGFANYVKAQLRHTSDINELRKAFEIFDASPPTGKLNAKDLRHSLKTMGVILTDDEIDFLYREEDYWMLDENYTIEYEQLINKLLNKPCNSKFLNSTE